MYRRTPPDLRTLDVADYRLSYAEQGRGAPLLLVHGSLCDCRYWGPQMAPLGEGFHVIAPSLRHYWPERWDGRGGGFSVQRHADDLAALIHALDAGPVHVLGHSRGARVACELALRHPRYVRTLALADPGMLTPGHAPDHDDFRHAAAAKIRAGQTDAGLSLFIDAVSGAGTWQRMVPWFKEMARANAATVPAQLEEPTPAPNAMELRDIDKPTLLLGGALSPAPFPATLDALQTLWPHARRVTIEHASHGMNLAHPRAFNASVADFLASHERQAHPAKA